MDNIEVTGCGYCPFRNRGNGYESCNHPFLYNQTDLLEDKDVDINISPSWCPLKTSPITISLKQDSK